jgi:hypothetical protein
MKNMAKDSFFIRMTLDVGNSATFLERPIDLGAYVDALAKSVLRIHNVQVTYSDNTGRSSQINAGQTGVAQWQLTTQTQSDIVLDSNKSVISSGRCHMHNSGAAAGLADTVTDANGVNLQEWTNGYLVATEQIFLGGSGSGGFVGDAYVTVVLECTVETMSSSAAMALALSQQ